MPKDVSSTLPPDRSDWRTAVLQAPLTRRTGMASLLTAFFVAPSCAQSAGASPRSIGLFRNAGQVVIPDEVTVVQTSGLNRVGWGAARYAFDPAIDGQAVTEQPFTTFRSKNGRGFRLAEPVPDVTAFGAVGDGKTDDSAAIQRAIDSLAAGGGTVLLPAGKFAIGSTLTMRSGVNLAGVGAGYLYVDDANVFRGSWLVYTGGGGQPALRFRSVQDISLLDLGISAVEGRGATLLEIGSDNKPATKRLRFERVVAFGAELAVRWGLGSRLTALEQCDEIVFEQFSTHSCRSGFVIDAANAADFSKIEGGSLSNLTGVGFDLRTPGFMAITNVAAGFARPGAVMFRITGSSADPTRIVGCQSEGAPGTFLEIEGTNDQAIIVLHANVINQPVRAKGTLRIVSHENYVNAEVSTEGFVRWRSHDDNFAGLNAQPGYVEQIKVGEGGQFRAESMKNDTSFFGRYLPAGFVIYNGGADLRERISRIVVQKGVVCQPFVAGVDLAAGQVVAPARPNGHAYLVSAPGKTGAAEPSWPTGAGGEVQSGTVRLREIGPSAVLRDFEVAVS